MANHKRKRHPNKRNGCKLCKYHKARGMMKTKDKELVMHGFGKLRALANAKADMRDALG